MYEKFVELLQKYNVTTYQVAKATGISTAAFTGWKQGKWQFKADKLKKIADYFGIDVTYFYEDNNAVQISGQEDGYYVYGETARMAQEIFEDKDMRILFDAARDSRPEDLRMAADMLKRFKETNSASEE